MGAVGSKPQSTLLRHKGWRAGAGIALAAVLIVAAMLLFRYVTAEKWLPLIGMAHPDSTEPSSSVQRVPGTTAYRTEHGSSARLVAEPVSDEAGQ